MRPFKNWIISNELFLKIMLVVILSVMSVSFFTLSVVLNRSKKSYVESYKQSNQVIMEKIQKDYELLNDNITRIFDLVDSSQVIEDYLTTKNKDSQTIVDLIHQMEATRSIFETAPSNLILLGYNQATFVQNSNIKAYSAEEFLNSSIIKDMENSETTSQYFLLDSGPTLSSRNEAGLLFVRKLTSNKVTFGYALIFISEEHFSTIYQDLLDDTFHTVSIVNQDNQIVSSSEKQQVGRSFNEKTFFSDKDNVTKISLYSYHFFLYNKINLKHLVDNMNFAKPTIFITITAILFISFCAFFIIKRTTKPIYKLIEYLPTVTKGNFKEKIELTGTHEIKELQKAYNLMLQDLDSYFDHIIETESEKRLIEINALLLQIQPHFIYNTLTAIKFLVWQNENEQAIEGIDNFTFLLKHTINTQKEFVSLAEEINNIEAYVAILKLRYGDQIELMCHIENECYDFLVPKLIIQPIIENAYFHAFPSGKEGIIQIFSRQTNNQLLIEIIDNGVGFNTTQNKLNQNHLYSNSIGLENIKERIHLLYGKDGQLKISSTPGLGTTLLLRLPAKKE